LEQSGGPLKPGRVSLRCWGVRGSIPTPGAGTHRYGGNTSCVEVRVGSHRLVFDAGTGIRLLGGHMSGDWSARRANIFLTHFHWDHIQGFPFFAPLYAPGRELRIVGPEQDEMDIQTLFARQMGPVFFPVPFEALAANTSFQHLNEGEWEEDGVRIRGLRVRHPSFTLGYRIEAQGSVICYVPDNELEGGSYAVDGGDWPARFRRFVEGADVLIHDAMFTNEEYQNRIGWGHSTFEQALELAVEAEVKHLVFFHHSPDRTDDALDRILARFRERSADVDGPRVDAGTEGVDLVIQKE
jgi:phosphoribosyl 1,2-cyclic phosphodiesterase